MSAIQDYIDQLQGKLRADHPRPEVLTPEGLDGLLHDLYYLNSHEHLLVKLADHYQVSYKSLKDLLVGRQALYIHQLTDFTQPGSELTLQNLLRHQHAKTAEVIARNRELLAEVNEALRQTEFLRDQAARVLNSLKSSLPTEAP